MTNELKPCPFQKEGEVHELELVDVGALKWVRCKTCNAQGPCDPNEQKAMDLWHVRYKRTCHFFPSFNRDIWGEDGAKRMLEEYLAPPQPATLSTMDLPDCYECSACAWQVKQKPPAWMKCCANCGAEVADAD